jgi:hypothetical protein
VHAAHCIMLRAEIQLLLFLQNDCCGCNIHQTPPIICNQLEIGHSRNCYCWLCGDADDVCFVLAQLDCGVGPGKSQACTGHNTTRVTLHISNAARSTPDAPAPAVVVLQMQQCW